MKLKTNEISKNHTFTSNFFYRRFSTILNDFWSLFLISDHFQALLSFLPRGSNFQKPLDYFPKPEIRLSQSVIGQVQVQQVLVQILGTQKMYFGLYLNTFYLSTLYSLHVLSTIVLKYSKIKYIGVLMTRMRRICTLTHWYCFLL